MYRYYTLNSTAAHQKNETASQSMDKHTHTHTHYNLSTLIQLQVYKRQRGRRGRETQVTPSTKHSSEYRNGKNARALYSKLSEEHTDTDIHTHTAAVKHQTYTISNDI